MRAWEMSIRRYSGMVLTSAAIVLGGYGIMSLVTPTEEQLKDVRSLVGRLMIANDTGDAETIRRASAGEIESEGEVV
jgi:hypothetical protein